eukprot:2200503-Pyramimonas_sp.AAC.1
MKTFMYLRASSSVVGFFSKVQAVGYSSCARGSDADVVGMFTNVSSSARMFTINTECSTSRSDIALMPLRALTGLS